MISWCCESECYETKDYFICMACGAKKGRYRMHSRHPQDWTVLEEWLAKILDETYEELSEVERSFIDNMSNRIVSRWPLSKAQQDWLEDIYARTS